MIDQRVSPLTRRSRLSFRLADDRMEADTGHGRGFRNPPGKFLGNKGKTGQLAANSNHPCVPSSLPVPRHINLITRNASNWQAITGWQSDDDVRPVLVQKEPFRPSEETPKGRRTLLHVIRGKTLVEGEGFGGGWQPFHRCHSRRSGSWRVVVVLVDFIARSRPSGNREGVPKGRKDVRI